MKARRIDDNEAHGISTISGFLVCDQSPQVVQFAR